MNVDKFQFGLDTFGEVAIDPETGKQISYEQSLRNLVQEGILADKVGVDVIALGEHHRKEYSISSPQILLAALATVTENIILGTGVTVLSSDDPIRLYQQFATIDAISNGRAQIMLGRGSFTESYGLFGYDLQDYNELFEEKIELFKELVEGGPVTWMGKHTPTLNDMVVYPKMVENKLDVHVGVGGTPESVVRAARLGFPLMIAIIGGQHVRFKPYVELYQRAAEQLGMPVHPVGIHSHGVIAETDEEAREIAYKYYIPAFNILGAERGWSPMSKEQLDHEIDHGAYFVGSPETVAQKMAKVIKQLGIGRFDFIYGMGGQLQEQRFKTIELYGTQVIPRVRELLKEGN